MQGGRVDLDVAPLRSEGRGEKRMDNQEPEYKLQENLSLVEERAGAIGRRW